MCGYPKPKIIRLVFPKAETRQNPKSPTRNSTTVCLGQT